MSIVTLRSWMYEKKGCQIVIGVVMLLVMIGFIGPMFMGNKAMSPDGQPVTTIVEVGGKASTTHDLSMVQQLARENRQNPTTPREFFDREASEISQLVDLAAGDALAAKYNVQPTADFAIKALEEDFDRQLSMLRIQLQINKQLGMDATDKEFEEAVEKVYGRPLADIRKEEVDKFKTDRLENPEKGPLIVRSQAIAAVIEEVGRTKMPSEDELKKSYETRSYNRMAFPSSPTVTPDQAKAKAEKARAALAGGKAFAVVYKEMVAGTVPTPTELPMTQIEANKEYAPLKDLKKNEAVVVTDFGTPAVFQYISTKTTLPPDYEKNKAKLLTDFGRGKAATDVQDELKALKEDKSKIKWHIPQFELVYDLYQELTKTPPTMTAEPFIAYVKRAEDLEKAATTGAGDLLTIVKYVAYEEAYKNSKASEQINMKEDRAAHLAAALEIQDNTKLRTELADMHRDLKQPDEAADSLSKAVTNTIAFQKEDVAFIDGIERKAQAWQKASFFTADQADIVLAAVKTWRADKAQFDKEAEEQKKLDEQAAKELAEEQKKLEAENEAERKRLEAEDKAKAEEAKKKGTTPPATTGGTTGATGAATGTTGTTGLTGLTGATTGR